MWKAKLISCTRVWKLSCKWSQRCTGFIHEYCKYNHLFHKILYSNLQHVLFPVKQAATHTCNLVPNCPPFQLCESSSNLNQTINSSNWFIVKSCYYKLSFINLVGISYNLQHLLIPVIQASTKTCNSIPFFPPLKLFDSSLIIE